MRISLPVHSRASNRLLASLIFLLASLIGNAQNVGLSITPKKTFKASVTFHSQELTGRMMFKTISEDTVRFAFFNELGMSFVEGEVAVGGRRSAVSSSQFAVRSGVEIVHIASFLNYKSFRKNFGKAVIWFLSEDWPKDYGMVEEPKEFVYRKGKKFLFTLSF